MPDALHPLSTLAHRLGGWASLRMVERYANVTAQHMTEAVRRIA